VGLRSGAIVAGGSTDRVELAAPPTGTSTTTVSKTSFVRVITRRACCAVEASHTVDTSAASAEWDRPNPKTGAPNVAASATAELPSTHVAAAATAIARFRSMTFPKGRAPRMSSASAGREMEQGYEFFARR
jgi:hypothetical protein